MDLSSPDVSSTKIDKNRPNNSLDMENILPLKKRHRSFDMESILQKNNEEENEVEIMDNNWKVLKNKPRVVERVDTEEFKIHLIFFHNATDEQAKVDCLNSCGKGKPLMVPQQLRPGQVPLYEILDGCHY